MRVHVALAPCSSRCPQDSTDSSNSSEGEEKPKVPEQDQPDLEHPNHKLDLAAVEIPSEKLPEESPSPLVEEKTFAASILVERAMHLSLKGK